jgi:hypothetical protein
MSMGETVSELRPPIGLLFVPQVTYGMESHDGMMTGENQRTWRKTCPSATMSTIKPTWTDPGLCSERPTTNRLSHATVKFLGYRKVCNFVSQHYFLYCFFHIFIREFSAYMHFFVQPCHYHQSMVNSI